MRRRQIIIVLAGFALLVAGGLAALVALTGSSDEDLVIYTARLHYGEEEVFRRFADDRGYDLKLFGGTGSALVERLKAEGEDTDADLLVTVDGANLQQALAEDLLQPIASAAVESSVPENEAPATYEALGDPRYEGRLCLRTSDSVYNSSFVADLIAKDGRAATERMLRAWMDNDPAILGSDVDVLEAIEAGRCDVGLTNHYYLGRILEEEDPDFPVAPVWVNQRDRGVHLNMSGVGITRHSDNVPVARELVEFLVSPEAQELVTATNSEFPANPDVPPAERIADWRGFRVDPIDVTSDPRLQASAVELMNEVGWR